MASENSFPSGPHVMLSGPPRSGKDSIAGHLTTFYYYHRIAHADAVRTACAEAVSVPLVDFVRAPKDIQRPMLQAIGHNARYFDPDIWVNMVDAAFHEEKRWHLQANHPFRVVVTDCRYPNEVEWAKRNGFTVIRVDRDAEDIIRQMQDDNPDVDVTDCIEQLAHPVEHMLDGYQDFDFNFPSITRGHLAALIHRVANTTLRLPPNPSAQAALDAMGERERKGLPPFESPPD